MTSTPTLATLQHIEDLDALLDPSSRRLALVFKHSSSCGVSAEALDELQSHIEGHVGQVRYAMVTVQTHPSISDAVAKRLGVRHETPQAILVQTGRPVWSASHFRVTADALTRAIRSAAA